MVLDLAEAKSADGLISRQRGDLRASADQTVVSGLRSVLTWLNEIERRVSGRVRGVSGAAPTVVA